MKLGKTVLTIGFGTLLIAFFLFLSGYNDSTVSAATCPSGMSDVQCYNYLLEQYQQLQKEQGTLQNQLNQEQYKQLSLEDKISYMENQITQTQRLIKSLEVEIAAHDMEIKLLEKDIQDKEDAIALMKQEISVLEGTVNKRITESYKYSHLSAFDLFLDSKSFSNVLRKTKYLITTRSQDIASLEDYSQKATALKREEDSLSAQKTDLEIKQAAILTEKEELATQNTNLEAQVAEKNSLLAQSQAKSAELLSTLKQNKLAQSQLDAQIMAYINAHMGEMVSKGPVVKGSVIGHVYPGGNSCSGSTGPHLHFAISTSSSGTFYPNIDIYKSGYLRIGGASGLKPAADGWTYPLVSSGAYLVPLSGVGVYITQDYHDPNLNGVKDAGETQFYATDLSKIGGSANVSVLAAEAGTLSRGIDYCNQGYAIVTHPNGYRTIYVHLVIE